MLTKVLYKLKFTLEKEQRHAKLEILRLKQLNKLQKLEREQKQKENELSLQKELEKQQRVEGRRKLPLEIYLWCLAIKARLEQKRRERQLGRKINSKTPE